MIGLLAAGVVAQGLDAMTMRLDHEVNPLIVALGPSAYLWKIALVIFSTVVAWGLPRLPTVTLAGLRRAAAQGIAGLLLVAGAVGTWSNL